MSDQKKFLSVIVCLYVLVTFGAVFLLLSGKSSSASATETTQQAIVTVSVDTAVASETAAPGTETAVSSTESTTASTIAETASETTAEATTTAEAPKYFKAIHASGKVRIHSTASLTGPIIGFLLPGDTGEVIGSENGFTEISINGKTGYVGSAFLEVTDTMQ